MQWTSKVTVHEEAGHRTTATQHIPHSFATTLQAIYRLAQDRAHRLATTGCNIPAEMHSIPGHERTSGQQTHTRTLAQFFSNLS